MAQAGRSMATGHFLCIGDKTSCGGEILEGYDGWISNGRPRARDGDAVSCGVDGQVYVILGGVSFQILDGRPAAGTLDSVSSCPCNAIFFPSSFSESYTHDTTPSRSYELAPLTLKPVPRPSWATEKRDASPDVASAEPLVSNTIEPQEPGFYVVPKTTTYEALETELFSSPSMDVLQKFRALNPRRGQVKAGELIVLSDPNNQRCTYEETLLMSLSAEIHAEVASVSSEEADFTAEHHEQIRQLLNYGSKGIGVGEAMLGQHIAAIEKILKDIEQLHVRTFVMNGNLRSQDFMAERKLLLTQLDGRLGNLTRKSIGFPDHPKLKTALGLSSRSLIHHWSKAGTAGSIPGYATHFSLIAKASRYIKYGGFLGIALGGVASYMKVQEVCQAGETEACKRIRFTETGAFLGSTALGGFAASAGIGVAGSVCLVVGVSTAGLGLLVCGIAVAGVAGFGGGVIGGMIGERGGEFLYEKFH
jgi:uncharacterized Zn-binding protein involved in type VI secretion